MMNDTHQTYSGTLETLLDGLAKARDAGRLASSELCQHADVLLSGREHIDELGPSARESYLVAVEAFCYLNDELHDVLRATGVMPVYNFREDFPQASPHGPVPVTGTIVDDNQRTLLGKSIGFPIGVPASVLTAASNWVSYYADHGFNVLTFRTVRKDPASANPPPNWVFLDDFDAPLPHDLDIDEIVAHGDRNVFLRHLRSFSMANSFGVPSHGVETWKDEVRKSVDLLGDGKVLIISVMGCTEPGAPFDMLVKDFVDVTRLAIEARAPAIELNLSCPNTMDPAAGEAGVKAPLCFSVNDTATVVEAVAAEVRGYVPLVAKLSYRSYPELRPLVEALAPHVAAFSGINTLQINVDDKHGRATFPGRRKAGVSGVALRRFSLDFVRSLKRIRDDLGLSYEIIAMGGVMEPVDVHALLAVGADAVQTATAAVMNPRLPSEILDPLVRDPHRDADVVARIRKALYTDDGRFYGPLELAERLDIDRDIAEQELVSLSDLDLPRRVFELLTVGPRAPKADPTRVLGPSPSAEQVRKAKDTSSRLVDQQRQRLADRSSTLETFAKSLGWTVEEVVQHLEQEGDLLYFPYAGRTLIPQWQIERDSRKLLPGLRTIRQIFGGDPVAADDWVHAPNPLLDGRSPREVLVAGETERVLDSVAAIGAVGR